MILMSGRAYLYADAEPYDSGKEEEAEITEIDIFVSVEYCVQCSVATSISQED